MQDINTELDLDNNDRIATGSIQVVDYEKFIGVKATGSIEVLDYEELLGVKATGIITITAFADLADKTFTVGAETLTEGVDFDAEVSNNQTATNLAAALDTALNGVADVAADGAVITITATDEGRDGNEIGVSTNAATGVTIPEAHLLGGKDHATITVGEDVLVQGTDFTAETSNAVTATNIAAAIDGLAGYAASVDGGNDALVLIEAAATGVDGNVGLSATWDNMADSVLTLSGEALTGGVDDGTFTFGETVLEEGAGGDFTAEADNATTATNLAAAIDGIAGFSASVDGEDDTLVVIVADTAGESGNVAMSTNAPDAVVIIDMEGGADYFYSDILDYDTVENSSITIRPEVEALDGNAFASGTLQIDDFSGLPGVAATGTLTVVDFSGLAGDTVTVGATVLTEGVDWNRGASNDDAATSLAAAIDAVADVSAVAVGAVVTITADELGVAGNLIGLETNAGGDLTVGGVVDDKLSGGIDPATVTVGATVLTEGIDFDAEIDNATTAENLAAAIDLIAGVSAVADGDIVTVTNDVAGVVGNSVGFETTAGDITISGTGFLTGGLDAKVNFFVDVSFDKQEWEEVYQFDTMSEVGAKRTATLTEIQNFARVRVEVLNATASVQIRGMASQFGGDAEQTSIAISGEFVIPAELPSALSEDSVNFKFIDIQADADNAANVQIGGIVFTPGMSKRYTRGNLKDIIVIDGQAGDVVVWDGEQV